jgi:hypothetical protein
MRNLRCRFCPGTAWNISFPLRDVIENTVPVTLKKRKRPKGPRNAFHVSVSMWGHVNAFHVYADPGHRARQGEGVTRSLAAIVA